MPIEPLSPDQVEQLVGTHHPVTGIEYPPDGLQPYYHWLVRTLHLLAESSAGAWRVAKDDAGPTLVRIAPGRASIADVVLSFAGDVIDLASHNNDTVHLWLADDEGAAVIGKASASEGWPSGAHIKLAEVTLAAGAVTQIVDRRHETLFRV